MARQAPRSSARNGRRRALLLAPGIGLLLTDRARPFPARPDPSRPVRLVVPAEAGGVADVVTRIIAPHLAEDLGQPVLVENRAGAAGAIGTGAVVRAQPDGHALIIGSEALTLPPTAGIKLPFDAATDLSPVAPLATIPQFVFVNLAAPTATLADLVSLARRVPEGLTCASSGTGTLSHLAGVRFGQAIRTKLVHVPYRAAGPAINDLIAGHVDMMFTGLPTPGIYLKAARLRPLAVAAPARASLLPGVATFAEAGGPAFSVSAWFGVLAPQGTSWPVRARLAEAVRSALGRPEVAWRLRALGALPFELDIEQFEARYAGEIEAFRLLFKTYPGLLQ